MSVTSEGVLHLTFSPKDKRETMHDRNFNTTTTNDNAQAYNIFIDVEEAAEVGGSRGIPINKEEEEEVSKNDDEKKIKENDETQQQRRRNNNNNVKTLPQLSFTCNVLFILVLTALLAFTVGGIVLVMIYLLDNTEIGPVAFFMILIFGIFVCIIVPRSMKSRFAAPRPVREVDDDGLLVPSPLTRTGTY